MDQSPELEPELMWRIDRRQTTARKHAYPAKYTSPERNGWKFIKTIKSRLEDSSKGDRIVIIT